VIGAAEAEGAAALADDDEAGALLTLLPMETQAPVASAVRTASVLRRFEWVGMEESYGVARSARPARRRPLHRVMKRSSPGGCQGCKVNDPKGI